MHGTSAKTPRNENIESEHFLEKSSKKSFKNGPKYFSFVNDIYTMATFFQKVSKPVFQNLTVERHVSTPHIRLAKLAENLEGRTNGRTDGTPCFDCPTDVKSASRNKVVSLL